MRSEGLSSLAPPPPRSSPTPGGIAEIAKAFGLRASKKLRHEGHEGHEEHRGTRSLPPGSLHQPVLQCLRNVVSADVIAAAQIRDRARDLLHAVIAAGTESEMFGRALQQLATRGARTARVHAGAATQLRVG